MVTHLPGTYSHPVIFSTGVCWVQGQLQFQTEHSQPSQLCKSHSYHHTPTCSVCAGGHPGVSGRPPAKCGCLPNYFRNNLPGRPHWLPSAGHTTANCTLALLTRLCKSKIKSFVNLECTSYGTVKPCGIENGYSSCFHAHFWTSSSLFLEQPLHTCTDLRLLQYVVGKFISSFQSLVIYQMINVRETKFCHVLLYFTVVHWIILDHGVTNVYCIPTTIHVYTHIRTGEENIYYSGILWYLQETALSGIQVKCISCTLAVP